MGKIPRKKAFRVDKLSICLDFERFLQVTALDNRNVGSLLQEGFKAVQTNEPNTNY